MFQPTDNLTVKNASQVLRAGLQAVETGQREIDLSKLTAVDSSAVATLLAWQRAALARGVTLAFRAPPANLQSLMEVYGVAPLLGFETQGKAVEAAGAAI